MTYSRCSSWCRYFRADYVTPDLYDVALVARWDPYDLHLGQASWVGSVIYPSYTTSQSGRLGSR